MNEGRERRNGSNQRDGRVARERTCVGCGQRDEASRFPARPGESEDAPSALVRLVVADDIVAFDLAGGKFGRGAHVHARPDCLAKAPRGLARAFKSQHRPIAAAELGRLLTEACDRSMTGLLVTARRLRALAVGADAAFDALGRGAPLVVVAVDAGAVAARREVQAAVAEGRAVAWRTKRALGALLGEGDIAICAICHEGIAGKFKSLRAAADAGASMTKEGEGCSTAPGSDQAPAKPEICRPSIDQAPAEPETCRPEAR